MLKFYKSIVVVLNALLTVFFCIFYVALPYTAENNPEVTVTGLQAQALAFPIAGLFFEPIVMFIMLFIAWIFGMIVLAKKEGKTTTIRESY